MLNFAPDPDRIREDQNCAPSHPAAESSSHGDEGGKTSLGQGKAASGLVSASLKIYGVRKLLNCKELVGNVELRIHHQVGFHM
jgi:hypothetical protein